MAQTHHPPTCCCGHCVPEHAIHDNTESRELALEAAGDAVTLEISEDRTIHVAVNGVWAGTGSLRLAAGVPVIEDCPSDLGDVVWDAIEQRLVKAVAEEGLGDFVARRPTVQITTTKNSFRAQINPGPDLLGVSVNFAEDIRVRVARSAIPLGEWSVDLVYCDDELRPELGDRAWGDTLARAGQGRDLREDEHGLVVGVIHQALRHHVGHVLRLYHSHGLERVCAWLGIEITRTIDLPASIAGERRAKLSWVLGELVTHDDGMDLSSLTADDLVNEDRGRILADCEIARLTDLELAQLGALEVSEDMWTQ